MVADGLLTRQRYREVPPRVDYELTERARALLPVVGALARWGYQWAWSPPRPDEQVDVGAILRSITGLAAPAGLGKGVTVLVDRREGGARQYVLLRSDEGLQILEGQQVDTSATISGPERAWIEALGPDASHTELDVSGDRTAADALLDFLAPVAARLAAVA